MKNKLNMIFISPLILFFCCSYTNHNTLKITLYSFEKTLNNINKPAYKGHSFVSVTNYFGFPIELGYYQVNPNETSTFGLWSGLENQNIFTAISNAILSDYPGLYKDREAFVFQYDQMMDCYQYSVIVDRVTFLSSGINSYMKSINDHYDLLGFNCTCFAIEFFKYATGINLYDNMWGTSTPGGLKESMKIQYGSNVKEDNSIITKTTFYKYISTDKNMLKIDEDY